MSEAEPAPETTMSTDDVVSLLKEIRDIERQALERQIQFLWIVVPIFAVLCVQTILQLVR